MVLIMGHAHEDFDALGAAVGVSHLARSSHKETHIVLSKERDTCRKMVEAIEGSGVAEGLLIDESQAKGMVTDKTVVIVVDTHVPELAAAPEVLKKAKKKWSSITTGERLHDYRHPSHLYGAFCFVSF